MSKVPLLYADGGEAATFSVCGTRGLELARTRVVAVAVADFNAFDVPINLRHGVHLT
jgi:hypothetical protein